VSDTGPSTADAALASPISLTGPGDAAWAHVRSTFAESQPTARKSGPLPHRDCL